MFLCGDLEQRVRGGLARCFVRQAGESRGRKCTDFRAVCGLIGSRFLFFLQRFSLFCDSGKQVSKTLGEKLAST